MAKVALIFLGGCVFFGLLKLVVSVPPHVEEADLQMSETQDHHENQEEDKSGASASAVAIAGSHGPRPGPTPNPLFYTECYVCTDCPQVLPNTTSKVCPITLDPAKRGKCVVYAEKYKHMRRPWYIRGCASERGTCADIKQAHAHHADIVTLLLCTECEGDRCNTSGAARSITDTTMAFFAIMVTPLIAKYTLA